MSRDDPSVLAPMPLPTVYVDSWSMAASSNGLKLSLGEAVPNRPDMVPHWRLSIVLPLGCLPEFASNLVELVKKLAGQNGQSIN